MKTEAHTQPATAAVDPFAVSVVIPAHNAADHIERAVNSALRQTLSPEEVIVIDDASSDDTEARLQAIDDSRLVVLHRQVPGPGGYAARNAGVDSASGRWIAFLDADDEWTEVHLEVLRRGALRFPRAGMVSSAWRVTGAAAQRQGNHYLNRYAREGAHELDLRAFLARWARGRAPVWTSAACVLRPTLLAAGGFPEGRCTRGGDVDTWLRVMLGGTHMVFVPEVSAVYHREVFGSVTRERPPQVHHCTGDSVARALLVQRERGTRILLKRLANIHKKDPLRKKARRQGLQLSDLRGFYPLASPAFFALACVLAVLPGRAVRGILTVRDRAVSMRGASRSSRCESYHSRGEYSE